MEPQTTEDVDLTGGAPTPPEEGPNARHENAPDVPVEPTEDEIAALAAEERAIIEAQAAQAEEEEQQPWDGDEGSEESGQTAPGPISAESETPPAEPTTAEPTSAAPDDDGPTDPDDGPGGAGEAEEPQGEPEPAPEPEGQQRVSPSGPATRGYTFLEEQAVVPMHLLAKVLTEPQMKKVEDAEVAFSGFIPRAKKVQAKNADLAIDAVYGGEAGGAEEYVTAVLPLSERNFRPVELSAEVEKRTKLNLKRR